MSGENRSITTPPPAPSLFTVYTVGFHENVNYANQGFHLHDPPPKYEDVIKGEDLKSNYSTYIPPSTAAPAYQSIDWNVYSTYPHINTAQSENSSEENDKASMCSIGFYVLILCFIIALIVLRVTVLLNC